jgi:secondary thiamine-phosphate synthase enzyme
VERRTLTIESGRSAALVDLSAECAGFLDEVADGDDGLLTVFVPHATAGVVVMELGAGSDDDALATLERLLPRDDRWRHSHGSGGHGADHVVPLLASPSVTIPVAEGRMLLGTWQSVALLDANRDNPRRTVELAFVRG